MLMMYKALWKQRFFFLHRRRNINVCAVKHFIECGASKKKKGSFRSYNQRKVFLAHTKKEKEIIDFSLPHPI